MIEQRDLPNVDIPDIPSRAKIAKAAALALIAGGVLLVTIVLPAEYGVDPLGSGAALGIAGLSAPPSEPAPAPAADSPAPPAAGTEGTVARNTPHQRTHKVDSREILLQPSEGMEFKYHMEKGAVMVYTWKADPLVPVPYEFHGEPDNPTKKGEYESYDLDDKAGKPRASGSFTAPFTGIHGWYWKNSTSSPVTIQLTSAGFYNDAREFRKGKKEIHKLEYAR